VSIMITNMKDMMKLQKVGLLLLVCSAAFMVTTSAFEATGNQKTALEACGLPTDDEATSHCFADSTHHTCCTLGPEAREYADASGNPIGSASVRAFEVLNGVLPGTNDTTAWCTCFGSLVCGNYASMFPDDGTAVKFIYNKDSAEGEPEAAVNIPKSRECEEKTRNFYNVMAHMTPGIKADNSLNVDESKCEEYDPAENVVSL